MWTHRHHALLRVGVLATCALTPAFAAAQDEPSLAINELPDPDPERATEAPAEEPEDEEEPWYSAIRPFLVVVGGAHYDHIVNRTDVPDERQSRFTTLAMSRFGLEARIGDHISVRSEVELSAGLHGSSVWEGQAAVSVRDQYLRLRFEGLQLDLGRILDPASVDYYSAHVANLLLTDAFIRLPFLASGANRGNGIRAAWRPIPELTIGATVNAGNPVSFTGTAMVGGTYPPFSRFYWNIVGTVRESASRFPSDNFYAVLASPSVMLDLGELRAQASYQFVYVDVTIVDADNPAVLAHNFRGGLRGRFWDGHFNPFVNFSYVTNDVIASMGSLPDVSSLSNDRFEAYTASAGLDVEIEGRSGLGAQYNFIAEQQGTGAMTTHHFVNVGGSFWIVPEVAIEARYGLLLRCRHDADGCHLDEHQHTWFLTARGHFGGDAAVRSQGI